MARIKRNTQATENLQELIKEFLDEKESTNKARKTIDSYELSLKKFLSYNEDMPVNKIDIGNVIAYRKHMLKTEELKEASINHYLRDLRTFLNWCHENGYIDEKIKVELITYQEETKEVYTDEELEALLRKPTNRNDFVEWRTYTIICYILGTGNRIETICNLTMNDISIEERLIYIRKQKNKKPQTISIDRKLATVLNRYKKDWRSDASENEYFFCNQEGNKLSTNALQQALRNYNLERGVSKTSCHLLRHTFSKLFIQNGGSEFILQRMLGHSTLEMTRHYVDIFGIDMRKDIDSVSPFATLTKDKGGIQKNIKRKE